MKHLVQIDALRLWFGVVVLAGIVGLASPGVFTGQKSEAASQKGDSLALRDHFRPEMPSDQDNDPHIYDSSPSGTLLISKSGGLKNSREDLWLREASGRERWITNAVTSAKFSPDGNKIAYTTTSHELLVETLAGKRLAGIPRALEPVWSMDSATVKFTGMADLDYPDLSETAVYDLNTGQISEEKNRHWTAEFPDGKHAPPSLRLK